MRCPGRSWQVRCCTAASSRSVQCARGQSKLSCPFMTWFDRNFKLAKLFGWAISIPEYHPCTLNTSKSAQAPCLRWLGPCEASIRFRQSGFPSWHCNSRGARRGRSAMLREPLAASRPGNRWQMPMPGVNLKWAHFQATDGYSNRWSPVPLSWGRRGGCPVRLLPTFHDYIKLKTLERYVKICRNKHRDRSWQCWHYMVVHLPTGPC